MTLQSITPLQAWPCNLFLIVRIRISYLLLHSKLRRLKQHIFIISQCLGARNFTGSSASGPFWGCNEFSWPVFIHLVAQAGKVLLPSSCGLLAEFGSTQTVGRRLPSVPCHLDHFKVHKPRRSQRGSAGKTEAPTSCNLSTKPVAFVVVFQLEAHHKPGPPQGRA